MKTLSELRDMQDAVMREWIETEVSPKLDAVVADFFAKNPDAPTQFVQLGGTTFRIENPDG